MSTGDFPEGVNTGEEYCATVGTGGPGVGTGEKYCEKKGMVELDV